MGISQHLPCGPTEIHPHPYEDGGWQHRRAVSKAKVIQAKERGHSAALIFSAIISARVFAQTRLWGGCSMQINLFSPIPKLLSPSSSPLCARIYE